MTCRATIIVDLGFGDAGKGTMTDYLVRQRKSDLVVRHNGGPQAAHNVVLPDGRHHTFAQFGSGSFVPSVRTLLSRFVLIEPYAMLNEERHLAQVGVADAFDRLLVDERCRVITPAHAVANRIRERSRGTGAHGTCGMGVGECVSDSAACPDGTLLAGDLGDERAVRTKCRRAIDTMRHSLGEAIDFATAAERRVLEDDGWIDTAIEKCQSVARRARVVSKQVAEQVLREAAQPVFEGAQGVLLDEQAGFAPHTTWSRTTRHNADELLRECGGSVEATCIGVTRSYATRHGAGPFVSEEQSLDARLPEPHNTSDGAQGRFRRGVLDLVMLRYAIRVSGGVDELAMTHLDMLDRLPSGAVGGYVDRASGEPIADAFDTDSLRRAVPVMEAIDASSVDAFCRNVEERTQVRVSHRSWGPTHAEKSSLADDR